MGRRLFFVHLCILGIIASSLAASPAAAKSIASITDYSEAYYGALLYWQKGYYRDLNLAGSSNLDLPFGMNVPAGYTPGSGPRVPLVIFLHGAGSRSNWKSTRNASEINKVLQLISARNFAWTSQTNASMPMMVLAPQVPTYNERWAETDWYNGPYALSSATHSEYMFLLERLLYYLLDPTNTVNVMATLGVNPADIDPRRIWVIGESMGGYGVWDLVARQPALIAAGVAAAGSGPGNRLADILQTPVWAIHGISDSVVPNFLPNPPGDPGGGGSRGILGLLDPTFVSLYLDDPWSSADDPALDKRLIYSEFGSSYDHAYVSLKWSNQTSGILPWLYGQAIPSTPDFLSIQALPGLFRLTWAQAGPYELQFDETPFFTSPVKVDVSSLTTCDFITDETTGFFRLVDK